MINYPEILDAIRASADPTLRLFFQRLTFADLVEQAHSSGQTGCSS